MYSRPMMPKQVDSIFDLLESYECEEIVLKRQGCVKVAGHVHPQYVLQLRHEGIDREWRDHSLPRLLATAVTEITVTKPSGGDTAACVAPYGA